MKARAVNATVTRNTFSPVYFCFHILFQDTKIHCKVGKSSGPQTLRHQKFHMQEHCTHIQLHYTHPLTQLEEPQTPPPISLSLLHALTASFSQPLSPPTVSLALSPLLYGSTSTWFVMHKNPTLKDTVSHKHSHWIWRSLVSNRFWKLIRL